jgi:hypothetical protein
MRAEMISPGRRNCRQLRARICEVSLHLDLIRFSTCVAPKVPHILRRAVIGGLPEDAESNVLCRDDSRIALTNNGDNITLPVLLQLVLRSNRRKESCEVKSVGITFQE